MRYVRVISIFVLSANAYMMLRFVMWLFCVFLLGRECAILLPGHLGFIVLECVRDVCVTGVGLLCAAIWSSFRAML
jgi:hypothetical protein